MKGPAQIIFDVCASVRWHLNIPMPGSIIQGLWSSSTKYWATIDIIIQGTHISVVECTHRQGYMNINQWHEASAKPSVIYRNVIIFGLHASSISCIYRCADIGRSLPTLSLTCNVGLPKCLGNISCTKHTSDNQHSKWLPASFVACTW